MAVSIIKSDSRGAYRLVAQEDLYLDESQQKVIVVKQGEEVPKEAAFVLAGKGGTIPARYEKLLKSLDQPEVKDEVEKVEVKPEVKADTKPTEAKVKSEPKPAKPEPAKENTPA